MKLYKTDNDNTIGVIQNIIKSYKISVNPGTVFEYLKYHPEYPSLKSITDAFNEWGIENHPLRLNRADLLELGDPFIAHVVQNGSEELMLIYSISETSISYSDSRGKRKLMQFDDFCSKWDGIVVLINPDENSGEKNYRKVKQKRLADDALLPLMVVAFAIYVFYHLFISLQGNTISGYLSIIAFVKIFGIGLSIMLIMLEMGNSNSIIDKLCHVNKKTNCSVVVGSEASFVFGWVSWADVGLIYFTGSFMILISNLYQPEYNLLSWLNLMTMPYCFFSLYYQWRVLKNWCPLCLGILTALVLEFFLLKGGLLKGTFDLSSLVFALLCFVTITSVWLTYKAFYMLDFKNDELTGTMLKFKRNSSLFNFLLTKSAYKSINIEDNSLISGNRGASVTITAFLSLNCAPCTKAFNKIYNLLRRSDTFKVNFILMEKNNRKIIQTLSYIYFEKGEAEFLNALHLWYNSSGKTEQEFFEKYKVPSNYVSFEEEHRNLFLNHNIMQTPTILIQGYELPQGYNLEDLYYFNNTLGTFSADNLARNN